MEASNQTKQSHLTIGVNDPIPLGQAILLGLQHVLAMDVYVVPFIIATAVAMSPGDAASLIQSTFLGLILFKNSCLSRPVIRSSWCNYRNLSWWKWD